MRIRSNFIFLLIFLNINFLFSQTDTIAAENLNEVVIKTKKRIKLKRNKGIYEVSIKDTNFEDQQNIWESLKNVPLVQVRDNSPVKINGKIASIFINGIESNLSSNELEDFLKSIDPKLVKQLEINTNPNVSYDSSVASVLNIELEQLSENYRFGVSSTNGVKANYYNFFSTNYAVNIKKTSFYTNYSFSYLPQVNSSEITRKIDDEFLKVENIENDLSRKHTWFSSLTHSFSKNNKIDFSYSIASNNDLLKGRSFNKDFNRSIAIDNISTAHKISQVWRFNINDSLSLDLGSYQVFRSQTRNNFANENSTLQNQGVDSDIALITGFVNFKFQNLFGYTSFGYRINRTNGSKQNFENTLSFPFKLKEQISSFYLNHVINISKKSSIDIGVRSELSDVSFSFINTLINENFSNKFHFTNLLYNATYNWENEEKKSYHSLGFRKTINRPNYNYLNPFQSINRDVTLFEGDFNISPSKLFIFSYEKSKMNWNYYLSSGINVDFISSFYAKRDNNIVLTYQNFDEVRFINGGIENTRLFLKKKWESRNSINFSIFKIYEDQYRLDISTPDLSFSSSNIIDLGKNFKFNFSYLNNISYKDGTLLHFSTQRFDIGLSKKINSYFTLNFFINDFFKSNVSGLKTILPDYLYRNISYNDVRAFGLNVRYNILGKLYKNRAPSEPSSNEIDRLD